MSRAYDHWIHQQLEPNDVIIKGNHKWHQPIVVKHAKVIEPVPDYRTEKEIEMMEDEYLRKHGIS